MSSVWLLNLETDFPTLEEARKRLQAEIKRSHHSSTRVIKVIHGYGSTGQGGTLRFGLRKSLNLRRKERLIKDFIPGEDFSIFNPRALILIEAVPDLRGDPDLDAINEGVTFVWLR